MMSVQHPRVDRASEPIARRDGPGSPATLAPARDPESVGSAARAALPGRKWGFLLALAGILCSALWLGGCAASSDDSVADSQTSSAAVSNTGGSNTSGSNTSGSNTSGSNTSGPNTSRPNTSKPGTPAQGSTNDLAPSVPTTDLPTVRVAQLPAQARQTLALIAAGGPYPYSKDGTTFGNREGILPRQPSGFYAEYTVITPGSPDRGARRIVAGDDGSRFYTDDHYASFREVIS